MVSRLLSQPITVPVVLEPHAISWRPGPPSGWKPAAARSRSRCAATATCLRTWCSCRSATRKPPLICWPIRRSIVRQDSGIQVLRGQGRKGWGAERGGV